MKYTIGIDIGGTNTEIGLVDENGHVVAYKNLSTRAYPVFDMFVDTLSDEIKTIINANKDKECLGIGIGAPNANYYNGMIQEAVNLLWRGDLPLKKEVEKRTGLSTYVTNDANAAAIGEKLFGAAQGMRDFAVITLGTGVGSGIVVNDEMVYGHDGFAGELGHIIIEENGRLCNCGRYGCLETYASVTGLVNTARQMAENYTGNSTLKAVGKENITGKMIGDAARDGDELAIEIFDYTARKLGIGLANLVAITRPEAIILYGGMVKANEVLLVPTEKYMNEFMLHMWKGKVKLLKSTLPGPNAAIVGAAALAAEEVSKGRK
jgi:glucokinase